MLIIQFIFYISLKFSKKNSLIDINGIYSAKVNLNKKMVTVIIDNTVTEGLIISAVEKAGYSIINFS